MIFNILLGKSIVSNFPVSNSLRFRGYFQENNYKLDRRMPGNWRKIIFKFYEVDSNLFLKGKLH